MVKTTKITTIDAATRALSILEYERTAYAAAIAATEPDDIPELPEPVAVWQLGPVPADKAAAALVQTARRLEKLGDDPLRRRNLVALFRDAHGLTQKELAALLDGMPHKTIEEWERGRFNPPTYILSALRGVAHGAAMADAVETGRDDTRAKGDTMADEATRQGIWDAQMAQVEAIGKAVDAEHALRQAMEAYLAQSNVPMKLWGQCYAAEDAGDMDKAAALRQEAQAAEKALLDVYNEITVLSERHREAKANLAEADRRRKETAGR